MNSLAVIMHPMIQAIKRRLDILHTRAATCFKRVKKPFTGMGEMMELYEGILAAAKAADKEAIKTYMTAITQQMPDTWHRHYHKCVELVLLCQLLLINAENTREIAAARYRLEKILNEDHEIGQRIRAEFLTPS